jgi:hypothetical protein
MTFGLLCVSFGVGVAAPKQIVPFWASPIVFFIPCLGWIEYIVSYINYIIYIRMDPIHSRIHHWFLMIDSHHDFPRQTSMNVIDRDANITIGSGCSSSRMCSSTAPMIGKD